MSKASFRIGGGKWAVKEDKVLAYAQGDVSGDFIARELTFSRGDNVDVTRINKKGYIEKFRRNLFYQSNNFNTTWAKNGITMQPGFKGYDGKNNAWKMTKTAAQYKQISQQQTSAGIRTISVYAKAGTLNHVSLFHRDNDQDPAPDSGKKFDLVNGVVKAAGSAGSAITASMTHVGDGWWRCEMSYDHTGGNIVRIYADFDESEAGYIFIQDAQLEFGQVATGYIESGSSRGEAGHSEDMPRIDYKFGKPQLLLERSRTNFFICSEYAGGNARVNSPVLTENYAISPEGSKNAFRIQDTTPGLYRSVLRQKTKEADADLSWTLSVFVKKALQPVTSYGGIALAFEQGTANYAYVGFDEYEGKLTHLSGSVAPVNDNRLTMHPPEDYGDYWRFAISVKDTDQQSPAVSNGNTSVKGILYARLSDNGISTGTTETKSYVAYGLQLETGMYPTSYIPTYGVAKTRSFEDIDATLNSSTKGITGNYNTTVMFDGANMRKEGNTRFITLLNTTGGSQDPRVLLFTGDNSNNKFRTYAQFRKNATPADDVVINGSNDEMVVYGQDFKCLLRLNDTKMALYINGIKQGEETIEKQEDIESLDLTNTTGDLGFYVNDIQVFPYSLSNFDCEVLTTVNVYNDFADMKEILKYN